MQVFIVNVVVVYTLKMLRHKKTHTLTHSVVLLLGEGEGCVTW